MEGGFLGLIVGVALLPLLLWLEHNERFRRLHPLEQNLRRASHGAMLVGFVLLYAVGCYSTDPQSVRDFFTALANDPGSVWVPAAILGGLLAVGLIRGIAGAKAVRKMRGTPGTELLLPRAIVKIAVGGLGLWGLWSDALDRFMGNATAELWVGLTWGALNLIALWCLVTGLVRFLLLALPAGGGDARRMVGRHIRDDSIAMHPARPRRRWWKFW